MLIGFKNQYCEMAIFPEALYRLNTTSIKTPMPFSQKQKKILKLIWKQRNPMKPMNHHTRFQVILQKHRTKCSMAPAQKPDTIRLNQSKRQTNPHSLMFWFFPPKKSKTHWKKRQPLFFQQMLLGKKLETQKVG